MRAQASPIVIDYRQDPATHWWTATVPGEPVVSQGRTLEEAYRNVRQALSLVGIAAIPLDCIDRTVWDHRSDLSPEIMSVVRASGDLRLALLAKQCRLHDATRKAIEVLRREGYSYRQAGRLLGISHARVDQIYREFAGENEVDSPRGA